MEYINGIRGNMGKTSMETERLHILFIEDHPGFARLLQRKMVQNGYSVEIAREGKEGLELFDPDVHDAVLIDYALPDLNGLQVLEAISTRGILTPKVMITGFGSEEIAVKALKLGAADYLVKDANSNYIELLPSVIERAVRQQRTLIEKKEAEQKLIEQQNLLRTVFSSTPEILVMKDKELRYRAVNQAFCRYAKRNETEIIGKTDFDLFPRQEAEYLRRGDLEVLQSKKSLTRNDHVDRDGKQLHFAVSKTPVLDSAGESSGLVISASDITDLLEVTEELEEAKKEAEAANGAKSEFLANISHELRTPLTAVIGFSEILASGLAGAINEKQKKYVKAILESGKYLLQLINDILDISKVECGKMQLDTSQINIKAFIEGSVIVVKERAAKRGIKIDVEIPERIGVQTIKADERKLRQVLYNLLSNAVKFTPSGGRVTVGVGIKDDSLAMYVKDTGIGIDPKEQKKIFDKFYQVRNKTKVMSSGTGLGLALTNRLAQLHGGKILMESEGLGKGSCFTCLLPVRLMKTEPPG